MRISSYPSDRMKSRPLIRRSAPAEDSISKNPLDRTFLACVSLHNARSSFSRTFLLEASASLLEGCVHLPALHRLQSLFSLLYARSRQTRKMCTVYVYFQSQFSADCFARSVEQTSERQQCANFILLVRGRHVKCIQR